MSVSQKRPKLSLWLIGLYAFSIGTKIDNLDDLELLCPNFLWISRDSTDLGAKNLQVNEWKQTSIVSDSTL